MRCEFCGKECQPGARFCSTCGTRFPEIPPESSFASYAGSRSRTPGTGRIKKPLPVRKLLPVAIVVIIIIVAAIIVIPTLTGPRTAMRKDSINFFYDGDLTVVSGNNNAKFTIEGKYVSAQRSLDGSKVAILTDYPGDSGETLWFCTTSGSYKVAEDVIAYRLADSGNGLVYLTDHNDRGRTAILYLFDTTAGKQVTITEEAMNGGNSGMLGMICISPNGKSISYISDYDYDDGEFTGYIKLDGKNPERLGKNIFAVAISDGGRHLYYVKTDEKGMSYSLYVKSGRNDNRLISDISGTVSPMLNIDYSQIIFNDTGKSYISVGGGEKVRIGGTSVLGFVLPRGAQTGGNSDFTTVYGVRDFANNVIRNENGLAYMDNKYETARISGTSDHAQRAFISDDGKTLLYINNNGRLSVIDPRMQGAERTELARDVYQFIATNNCKTIYYINDDGELWCIKGSAAATKISEDIYREYLVMPYGGNSVFFLFDYSTKGNCGELYISNNGGKKIKIPGGDDVARVWVTPASVFFRTIDNTVYRSGGDERFVLFAEDVR